MPDDLRWSWCNNSGNKSESHSVMSDSLWPHGLYSPRNSPGQNTGVVSQFPSLGDLPNSGIELRSPILQTDSFQAEPPGNPNNNGNEVHSRCNALDSSQNDPPAPKSWKNCLPRNWSLVSKKAGGHCLRGLLQGGYKRSEAGDLDSNPDSASLPCITTEKSFNLPNLWSPCL